MSTPSGWYVLFAGIVTDGERAEFKRHGWLLREHAAQSEPDSELCHLLLVPEATSRGEAERALRTIGRPSGDLRGTYSANVDGGRG